MKARPVKWFLGIAVFTGSALCATIGPSRGSLRVVPVFEKSDLVCNCFVESITVLGERQAGESSLRHRRVRAVVRIRDSYKTPDPNQRSGVVEFEHYWPGSRMAEPVLHEEQAGLLFLMRSRHGKYEFADRFLGVTTFRSLPRQSGGSGLQKLESALMGAVLQSDREERIRALELLHGFDGLLPSSVSSLVPLSSSKDPEIAFWALAVLLNAQVPGSLESLNKYLQTYEGNSTPIAWTGIDSDLHQIRDPEARPLLETLTESRHVPIRFGAMQALRKIKSPKSAPALVRRLDDSDRTVQYIAVISLAEILGKYEGDYAPAMPTFEKNPGKYTDLWKQWWAEHGQVPKK